jgi:hypothetical protein
MNRVIVIEPSSTFQLFLSSSLCFHVCYLRVPVRSGWYLLLLLKTL